MDINGLIYLLNQAGSALAEANSRIAELTQRVQQLEAAQSSESHEGVQKLNTL